MTLGLPWRCVVIILIALIIAVAALSYHPSKRRTIPALWSRQWMGPRWYPGITQAVFYPKRARF